MSDKDLTAFPVLFRVSVSAENQRCQIQWVLTGCFRHSTFDLTIVSDTVLNGREDNHSLERIIFPNQASVVELVLSESVIMVIPVISRGSSSNA